MKDYKSILKYINGAGFKKYFFNTGWLLVDQVLRLVAGLFVGIFVARYLGPSKFGIFNYAIALAAILGAFAKIGMDSIIIKRLVEDSRQKDDVLGTGFWLKIISAVGLLCLVYLYFYVSGHFQDVDVFALILIAALVFQSFEVIDFFFQAKVMTKFISIYKTIQLLISSAVKLYLIFIKADLYWFVVVQFFDSFTLAITQLLIYRSATGSISFLTHFKKSVAIELIKTSWPLLFGGVVVMLYMRLDQVMIMNLLGEKETGIFSSAVRISEAWYFVPVAITNSLFPAIVNAKLTSQKEYQKRLRHLFTFMVIVSLTVAVFVTIFSGPIIKILFGVEYSSAANVLSIHVWAGIFVSLGLASSGWFINENLQKFSLIKSVIGVILNVILNYFLIPRFGIIGAALATLISQSMVSVFFNVLSTKSIAIFKMQIQSFNILQTLKSN